jgi:hypothetical protein
MQAGITPMVALLVTIRKGVLTNINSQKNLHGEGFL